MGLAAKNTKNNTVKWLLAPFLFVVKLIKWFSLGLFKTSSLVIEYVIDLVMYMANGIYVTTSFFGKYLYLFIRKEVIGIYTFLKFIYRFFYLMFYGIYVTFKFIFVTCLLGLYRAIGDGIMWIYNGIKKMFRGINEGLRNLRKKIIKQYYELSYVKKRIAAQEKAKQILLIDLDSPDAKRSEKLQTYTYLAKNQAGKMVKGIFNGYSKLDVNSYLINEGFEVYKIETSKWINFYYGEFLTLNAKMKNKDLIFWLEQLSTYIRSGIPLTTAIRILGDQMGKKGSRKRTFESIVYELSMGESFSSALSKQTNVFPALLINMIKAAEATGELEATLTDMADYYREIDKTNKQMKSAMTYPIAILIFAVGVLTFIMLFVVPKFAEIFNQSGTEITGVTLTLLNLSNFLQNNIFYLLAMVLLVILLIILLYKKVKAFRVMMQSITMKLPIIGNIIIYNEMMIFTKTFASLLKNNVFITESIDILSKITKNEIYKDIMFNTITNIAKGDKISDAFKDHWAIPEVAYFMIVTGESTGELANMMTSVSEYYQEMHRNAVNTIKNLIEPTLIILLALIVGVVLLAVVIPMFDMYNTIQM